jgi:hypothetical protein
MGQPAEIAAEVGQRAGIAEQRLPGPLFALGYVLRIP